MKSSVKESDPKGANSFSNELNPIETRVTYENSKVASPENVSVHLKNLCCQYNETLCRKSEFFFGNLITRNGFQKSIL